MDDNDSSNIASQYNVIDTAAVRRKVARRVLPLIFLLYIAAYLDRANAGFAKLAMAGDLKFSDAVFGYGFGIFFVGYLFLEIPGALLVERWSARKWFSRILISWGIVSALTGFVKTPGQFYAARFVLGVAEAGLFPGIIVYFTHWFTSRDRARALSGLIMAVPFSRLPLRPVVRSQRRAKMARRRGNGIHSGLPRRQQCSRSAGLDGRGMALPDRGERIFLALPFLGFAHTHARRIGRRRCNRIDQHVRQFRRLPRQPKCGLPQVSRLRRSRLPAHAGRLLHHRSGHCCNGSRSAQHNSRS